MGAARATTSLAGSAPRHRLTWSARRSAGGRGTARRTHVLGELAAGSALLAAAALAGAYLVHRPWPDRVDTAGFALIPADPSSRIYRDIAEAGSLRALVVGALLAALVAVWRDRTRAVACLVGPALAVLVTERIAKPLVGRHLAAIGANSYPSGTVTAATAIAVALLVAMPRRPRMLLVLPLVGAVAAVCVAVVAMRWHYPTDAAGGVLVGAGSVLALDAVVHLPVAMREPRARWRGARPTPGIPAGEHDHLASGEGARRDALARAAGP